MAGPVVALLSTMAVACDAFFVPALQHGTLGGAGLRFGGRHHQKGTCVEESGRRRPAATLPATTKMMLGAAGQVISADCLSIPPSALLPGRVPNIFLGGRGRGRGEGTLLMDDAGKWSRTRMRTRRATVMHVASSSSSSFGKGGKLGRGRQRKEGEGEGEGEGEDKDEEDEHEVPPKYEGTIYAQSTAQGMGGIAVVRVSGVDALPSLAALSKPGAKAPKPRYAGVRSLVDPESGALLDKALVLYFEGPNTFTGEDLVEYHLHGGVAIVKSVLAALSKVRGLRMAGPGEFTRRAYLNGRMDLLEAEALNDLIHAETSGQQKQVHTLINGHSVSRLADASSSIRLDLALLSCCLDIPPVCTHLQRGDVSDLHVGLLSVPIPLNFARVSEMVRGSSAMCGAGDAANGRSPQEAVPVLAHQYPAVPRPRECIHRLWGGCGADRGGDALSREEGRRSD